MKRELSAEGRANIAAAQKARWAAKRAGTPAATFCCSALKLMVTTPTTKPRVTRHRPSAPAPIVIANTPADSKALLRSAIQSLENERTALTVRIDTLKQVLVQM